MKRRQFIAASSVVLGAPALLAQTTTTGTRPLSWHKPEDWGVEGRLWQDQPRGRWHDRLPASAEGRVPQPVWDLSRHSAGMAVRFRTDATLIRVRYRLTRAELSMPHMPATGASGVDLYARDPAGKWRWVAVAKPTSQEIDTTLITGIPAGLREWMLYLPIFNGVASMEIGVPGEASFEGLPPRKEKEIVFYGTSITHGACASRPGMTHVAMLGRRLDVPTVNLGFSGNGRMDAAVGHFLAQADPAVFVIDCLPNMSPAQVTERTVPLVTQLRGARPDTPILLVESRRNTESWISPALQKGHDAKHAALKAEYEKLLAVSVKELHYLTGNDLLGDDADACTDGSHPSDLGFYRQADAFEPILRRLLGI